MHCIAATHGRHKSMSAKRNALPSFCRNRTFTCRSSEINDALCFFASARGLFTHLNSVTPAGFSCDQEHLKQTDSKTISFEAHWFVYLIVLLVFHWLLW
jgi:hypothetical protein